MTLTLQPKAERVVDLFLSVDVADVEAGIAWYGDAFDLAHGMASYFDTTPEQVAGVMAALSPMNEWSKNVRDTERFLADQSARVHTDSNMGKARRIMAGENIESVLSALKTTNFYTSIISRGERGVCIDRHAFDIAVGVRHTDKGRSIGVTMYRACAREYVIASEILSSEYGAVVTPAETQSVTWEAWRAQWKGVRNTAAVVL